MNQNRFDFNSKLEYNPAYFEKPGTGPKFRTCADCKHLQTDDIETPTGRFSHPKYCGLVVNEIGKLKQIKVETAACSAYVDRIKLPRVAKGKYPSGERE